MAKRKKNKNKNKKIEEAWSLFPELHDDVTIRLEDDGLSFAFLDNVDEAPIREWDTNIMGRSVCRNGKCSSPGWGRKRIPITIQMYPSRRYNVIVYHQRCRKCDSLSRPILNDSYDDRVAYRLKKWSGVRLEAPQYTKGPNRKPHQRDLCEGCKAGHCKDGEGDDDLVSPEL